jgi:hypothetical protein
MDDGFWFDEMVNKDKKLDITKAPIHLSSSITMTATGTESYNILKKMEDEFNDEKKTRGRKTIDKHKNITTETLLATEPYRIKAMFDLLHSTVKDTTKQQAVRYLLSYSDLLDKDMAREVIDIANKMMVDESVRDTVKVKVASDLKAFLGTAGKKKFVRSTFEELRKEDGFLEVEVPD